MKEQNKLSLTRIFSFLFAFALIAVMVPDLFTTTVHAFSFDDVNVSTTGAATIAGDAGETDFDGITTSIKIILQWVTGILSLIMFFFLIYQFTKLGASGDNEMARKKAIQGILTSGIALALFGGSNIVIGFFWNALSNTVVNDEDDD